MTRLATGLARPVYLTVAPGDTHRLYVLEQQRGRILVVDRSSGQVAPTPFLQLPNVSRGNEQGLLGVAFDPGYAENGLFYVNYTDSTGATNVVRYQVSGDPNVADPATAQTVLRIDQPQSNHNAGWMEFGPSDGYLYIATGDGGASDDNGNGHTSGIGNAQDLTDNLLGKLLRIDVTKDAFPADPERNYAIPADNPFVGQTGDDEIWAYGLRNPWRNSFDRLTGDLYIGDVGQSAREEINFQPANSLGGENYGWRLREGSISTPGVGGARPADSVEPIYEYRHDASPTGGFSVTGGYVYRGPIEPLQGHYFFADYVSSQVWSFRYDGQQLSDFQYRTEQLLPDEGTVTSISSFGEDHEGNVYLLNLDGDVFRIDGVVETQELVAAGSLWRYLDDGSNQDVAWRDPSFDDSAWRSGLAELGYGDNDEATVLGFGDSTDDRFETTYFRHHFEVADVGSVEGLLVNLLRDDGAAVYLNGTEVFRTDNLASDAGYEDLANFGGASAIGGSDETTFLNARISPDLLVQGTNVLAVEMHQHSRTSSDLSFDLRLLALLNALPKQAGDVNRDGTLDAGDIDELTSAIAAGSERAIYDLNADGMVNEGDRLVWIHDLRMTWMGDSNLDGEFNESDLVFVMQTGLYEDGTRHNSGWSDGDWNGDQDFTTTDLVVALADGGYRQGLRAVVAAVPEPNGLAIVLAFSLPLPWALRRDARQFI